MTPPQKPKRLTYFIKAFRHNRDDGNQCINSDSEYSEGDHTLNVNNNTVLLHKQPTYFSGNGQVHIVHPTCCDWDDCVLELTSQHRISCETTWWSLVNSGYWYLMGGPGPSSKATSIKVAGTFSCKNRIKTSNGYLFWDLGQSSIYWSSLYLLEYLEEKWTEENSFSSMHSSRITHLYLYNIIYSFSSAMSSLT